jgi:hypothetical protein
MKDAISYTDHARGMTITTREEFKEWVGDWAKFFSDGKITKARYVDAGDTTISQFTGRGTNDGTFGPYPATGREIVFDLCEILTFDGEGRIAGGDIYYDQLGMLIQLGHVEVPAAATT